MCHLQKSISPLPSSWNLPPKHPPQPAALAEQEPVAWWHRKSNTFTSGNLVSNFAEWTPLYAAPQPKREPLTDEDIDQVTDTQWASNNHKPIYAAHRAYARAIERAHGIGGQP